MSIIYKLSDVYVSAGMPNVTYVSRPSLERSVQSWEMNKAKHLLIFGPSKIGKTSLWKRYLPESKVIKIPCNSKTEIESVYIEILSQLDAYYTSEINNEFSAKATLASEIKAALAGIFSVKGSLGSEFSGSESKKTVPIVQPSIGPNLIIKFLKPSEKVIVLEDFHYLKMEFRQIFSQDLKAFSDDACPWIIVGVQHKTSELLVYNTDLQQRITEISVDSFSEGELLQIIELGEKALNIKFADDLKTEIIQNSFGSASLVQEICHKICQLMNIEGTVNTEIVILDQDLISKACFELASEKKSSYEKIIARIAQGGRSDGSTEKYKWFLKLIRDNDIPEQGLKNTEVLKLIKDMGHQTITQGSVTSGLNYLQKLLVTEGASSFFDYTAVDKRFYLLDKYMKFVFKWRPELVDNLFNNH